MRYATWIDQEEQAIGYGAMQADYALQVQHDQAMGVNSALLLTTLEAKAKAKAKAHGSPIEPQTHTVKSEVVTDPWEESDTPLLDLATLTNATLLLIWGVSGSGKTSLVHQIALVRQQAGHSVLVADPHGSLQDWHPFEVIGSGLDYERLSEFLAEYRGQIKEDYKRYAQGERNFDWSTLVVDEFTGWADEVPGSREFMRSACSDLRKVKRCVLLVSHTDTLAGLGKATGLKAAIERSAVKLELEAVIDMASGIYCPTGYGWLQYPGSPKQQVKIPLHPSIPRQSGQAEA
jgi:hypothetical protein